MGRRRILRIKEQDHRETAPSRAAESARRFYQDDAQARFYATDRFDRRRRGTDRRDKRALEKAPDFIAAEGRVLDCPCGAGRITQLLKSRGLEVSGVDISHEMLSHVLAEMARVSQRYAIVSFFDSGALQALRRRLGKSRWRLGHAPSDV